MWLHVKSCLLTQEIGHWPTAPYPMAKLLQAARWEGSSKFIVGSHITSSAGLRRQTSPVDYGISPGEPVQIPPVRPVGTSGGLLLLYLLFSFYLLICSLNSYIPPIKIMFLLYFGIFYQISGNFSMQTFISVFLFRASASCRLNFSTSVNIQYYKIVEQKILHQNSTVYSTRIHKTENNLIIF